MFDQFELDKKNELDNLVGSGLLKEVVSTNDNIIFHFFIEGVGKKIININKSLRVQIISNQVSELVYYSFEIQRQLLMIFKDDPKSISPLVLNAIINSLNELCSIYKSKHIYEWYDHCVSNRTLFLRDFMLFLAKINDYEMYSKVYKLHNSHLKFLANNSNYDYLTNHGIITDTYGLLALRGFKNKKKLDLANMFYNRSMKRIDHYISDDGVPLESSTTYWFLIYKLYKKIIEVGFNFFHLKPDNYQTTKLKKTEIFFDVLWLQGKYLRIGQSSGAYDYPIHIYKPKLSNKKSVLVVNYFDTGLIIINGYNSNCMVFFQLLINTQQIEPKIHGHEDNGIVSLFYEGKIYLDTPGSFKFQDLSQNIGIDPKSFRNQSVTHEEMGQYLNKIKYLNVNIINTEIVVDFELLNNLTTIKREIRVNYIKSSVIIKDLMLKGSKAIKSQYLLHSKGKLDNKNYKLGKIVFKGNTQLVESNGYLSVERGQIEKVPLLTLRNESVNEMEIVLNLSEISDASYNFNTSNRYNKRKAYKKNMLISSSKRRLINLMIRFNKQFR